MRRQLAGLMISGSLAVTACGGDDGGSAATPAEKRYCEVTRSIFRGQEQVPTDDEMNKWEDAAASTEIATDVKAAAIAYRGLNESDTPDFGQLEQEPLVSSFNRIEAFNEEKCGMKVE